MRVTSAIMRMLKPAFIKSSTITRRRVVSLSVPADVPAFPGWPREGWPSGSAQRVPACRFAATSLQGSRSTGVAAPAIPKLSAA